AFLARVDECVKTHGYCVIGVSEGIKNKEGKFLSESGLKDAFGHAQLGGVAPTIANLSREKLGYKYHWAVADYLQLAARHIASLFDVGEAYARGKAEVEIALEGTNAIMQATRRLESRSFRWDIIEAPLSKVANDEKFMLGPFISED